MVELENVTEPSNEDKMTILMSKIKLLGQEYIGSPHCFPVGNYFISDYFFIEVLCHLYIISLMYISSCIYFLIFFLHAHFRFSSETIGNKGM